MGAKAKHTKRKNTREGRRTKTQPEEGSSVISGLIMKATVVLKPAARDRHTHQKEKVSIGDVDSFSASRWVASPAYSAEKFEGKLILEVKPTALR